jgi:hypothetical protein
MEQALEIVIDQLVADDEFRQLFLRDPRKALHAAEEWGLPLCDSEINALIASGRSVWNRVAAAVNARLEYAA